MRHLPSSKVVQITPDAGWPVLNNELRTDAKQAIDTITVNGTPFYLPRTPLKYPYGTTKSTEQPRVIPVNEPVEAVESWVAGLQSAGVHVLIGTNVLVSRVLRLADILNSHRVAVSWLTATPPGASISIWAASTNSVLEEEWPNHAAEPARTLSGASDAPQTFPK